MSWKQGISLYLCSESSVCCRPWWESPHRGVTVRNEGCPKAGGTTGTWPARGQKGLPTVISQPGLEGRLEK